MELGDYAAQLWMSRFLEDPELLNYVEQLPSGVDIQPQIGEQTMNANTFFPGKVGSQSKLRSLLMGIVGGGG